MSKPADKITIGTVHSSDEWHLYADWTIEVTDSNGELDYRTIAACIGVQDYMIGTAKAAGDDNVTTVNLAMLEAWFVEYDDRCDLLDADDLLAELNESVSSLVSEHVDEFDID